ncbi:MAG: 30S ribosome-binding factor RbfA [Eubacteriales bacterium]|nr:30S ribosome-binding factor RbfA [Eubacteriales bacterium]
MARRVNHRRERVADAIKRLIASCLQREFRNQDLPAFSDVTEVSLSSDLAYATVYIHIPGDAEAKSRGLQALNHSKGYFRSKIAAEINLMHTPEVIFKEDSSIEYAAAIEAKIDEVMGRKLKSSTADASTASNE